MRTGVLITGLVVLLVANLLAMWGFQGRVSREGFTSYFLSNAGGYGANEKPMGPFDDVRLETGNGVSSWRYNHPNEPLEGNYPPFKVGPDNLFMFKDNQCKPECCGASFACDSGGCVCTTPAQRNMINTRGGNRTVEDGF
jgi:hypothetical protein